MSTINEELTYLEETKSQIKQAIIDKGQEISENDSFRSYVDKIDDIVTLEEGTADATATASDIIYDKTAYVNGNKITGSMRAYLTGDNTAITDMTYFNDDASSNRLRVTIKLKANNDGYVSSNFGLTQLIPYSSIQNKVKFLSAGNIKNGVTILGVQGSVVELNGETASVTPTTSQQTIVPTGTGKNALTEVTVNAVTSAIDNNIQAGNIKKGVTILGVSGKSSVVDTDNANATANDIIYGKSAYVNGHKINGQMIKHVGDSTYANQLSAPDNTDHFSIDYTSANDKIYIGSLKIGSGYWDGTASSNAYIDKNLVYTRLGLTANKIKKGVTILGITGTYAGSTMKEYASTTAMNNDIANIQEGEVVKVVASGVATYYIKDGTPVTYQPLDLSTLATGDTISLKGMKINNEATSNIITGNGDSKSITFSNNGQDVLELEFHGGAINISGSLTINGSTTYNYSGVTEGQNSTLSSADVEAINSNAIWNSDDLLTITKSYTISSREIENAILEQVGGYSMVKLVKESETLSPTDFEEAEEQIGDLFGEEGNE